MASSTDTRSENSTSSERDVQQPARRVRSVVLCGASVRSLAESAIQSGFRPLCVDFFEDADLRKLLEGNRGRFIGRMRSFGELFNCLGKVRRNVPLVWAGGLENHCDILGQIAETRAVIGPELTVVERLNNPPGFAQLIRKNGLSVPLVATGQLDPGRTWLRKSINTSGGLGVHAIAGTHTTSSSCTLADSDAMYQEYIDGVPMSAVYVASRDTGCHLVGTSLQMSGWPSLGASGFQFCGNAGPVELPQQLQKQVLAAGVACFDAGLRGVFGVDFILRNGELWFLEVNPRLTASHMIYEAGNGEINLFHEHLNAFGYQPAKRRRKVFASRPGTNGDFAVRAVIWTGRKLNTGGRLPESLWHPATGIRLCDVPEENAEIPARSPICSVEFVGWDSDIVLGKIAACQKNRPLQFLCDWKLLADAIDTQMRRFELNKVLERRRDPVRRKQ